MYKTLVLLFGLTGLMYCSSEEQQTLDNSEDIEPKDPSFTITNLYDAFGKDHGLTRDFGFSALITYNGNTILFDAGTNADILKSNVESLGIDLGSVDFAVGSHAHGDHLNGFDYLLEVNPEVKIYLPFDFYAGAKINFNVAGKEADIVDSLPDYMKYFEGQEDLNLTINQSGRFWKANAEFIGENVTLSDGMRLIFTRSPYLGYGSKYPSVEELRSQGIEDTHSEEMAFAGLPELSLALSTNDGEVVLVGCSHSSVQRILSDTKEYTGNNIRMAYGGYHMLPYGRNEILTVAHHLKNELQVAQIAPSHCTGHLAFKLLMDVYGEDFLFAGLGETIELTNSSRSVPTSD